MVKRDVLARAGLFVLSGFGVVAGRSRMQNLANIAVAVEDTHRFVLGKSRQTGHYHEASQSRQPA